VLIPVTSLLPALQSVTSREKPSTPRWQGPLFVAGTWRSGTSLLYALLNKHPDIGLLYEGDLFLLRPLFWMPGSGRRWLARWDFWNGALKRHGLDAQKFPQDISRLPAAMEKTYREYAQQKGALIWGEKSVHFHHFFNLLVQDFPDARFIFLWRDLAAICSSVIRAKDDFFLGRGWMTERTLGRYPVLIEQCQRLMSRGVPVHQIHYENLTKDPVAEMKEVCNFLDIPFVPEMASLKGADRSAIYEGGHHSLVRSEKIVPARQRSDVLSPDLKNKIDRSLSFWKERSGDRWPILWPTQKSGSRKTSWRERLFDWAWYRCLRAYDSLVAGIYCFAPLRLLQRYRNYKVGVLHQESWKHVGSEEKAGFNG